MVSVGGCEEMIWQAQGERQIRWLRRERPIGIKALEDILLLDGAFLSLGD
jgi:hypothetical protein